MFLLRYLEIGGGGWNVDVNGIFKIFVLVLLRLVYLVDVVVGFIFELWLLV